VKKQDHRYNENLLDPVEQEKIRRLPHEYVEVVGKHGMYREKPYVYQEYPKMMGKYPRPEYKKFAKVDGVEIPPDAALNNFQAAMTEWDAAMSASVVHSKTEEREWLANNGK
jgi:hypothetical protein